MDNKELNLSIEEYKDQVAKEIIVSFEDLIAKLQNCNWDWHMMDPTDEGFAEAKASYEAVVSCMDALRARYFEDPVMFSKIKKIHNQYSPPKYDIP